MESPPPPALLTERSEGVATLTIRNPAKRNAMTPDMWRAVPGVLTELARDASVRTVVLTGADRTFCAGADISTLRGDAETSQTLAVAAEEALAAFPKPTLAAVRGHCVGGGCQLAAACDFRFATDGALFGVTPAKLGLVYPASSTERMVRLVGPSAAKYLLFSADLIDADRALRTGLVDELHPDDALDARVTEFSRLLATRSQLTQAAAKEYADGLGDAERIAHWERQAKAGPDTTEGIQAFLDRRAPRFRWTPGS